MGEFRKLRKPGLSRNMLGDNHPSRGTEGCEQARSCALPLLTDRAAPHSPRGLWLSSGLPGAHKWNPSKAGWSEEVVALSTFCEEARVISPTACGALFNARTTPQPSWNPCGTWWNLTVPQGVPHLRGNFERQAQGSTCCRTSFTSSNAFPRSQGQRFTSGGCAHFGVSLSYRFGSRSRLHARKQVVKIWQTAKLTALKAVQNASQSFQHSVPRSTAFLHVDRKLEGVACEPEHSLNLTLGLA